LLTISCSQKYERGSVRTPGCQSPLSASGGPTYLGQ